MWIFTVSLWNCEKFTLGLSKNVKIYVGHSEYINVGSKENVKNLHWVPSENVKISGGWKWKFENLVGLSENVKISGGAEWKFENLVGLSENMKISGGAEWRERDKLSPE